MRQFPRLLVLMFLVVFTAGSAVAVASSAAMALDMAVVNDAGMKMDGCDGCHAANVKLTGAKCDPDCATPTAAIPSDAVVFAVPPATAPLPCKSLALAGRTGAPDRAPPRTTLLSCRAWNG